MAGEAGVPFLSVTGSDFMEMFVGVGASRVRDLFQTARKLGRAIIFVDEIDSIGRKRGAGLGGGHDEREQTLNQMLSEMDGFEATEGIVMMAATNRPDILDPALLRPGRFDRQVVVPLPELDERRAILEVHCKDKRLALRRRPRRRRPGHARHERRRPGQPGQRGGAVRRAGRVRTRSGATDFEEARDRVLMGQRRESMALSDQEKEVIAYHEAGHAVCAAVLPNADPVHKVTILPIGMALGVTQQLPGGAAHLPPGLHRGQPGRPHGRPHRRGARVRRHLHRRQQRPRRLDRAGPQDGPRVGHVDRIGPMAWGSSGQVFLGEDLMHTRDYCDETARVIDEEVERILREQEDRCRETLREHRNGLDLVARALLEHETIDGAEVTRLIDAGRRRRSSRPTATATARGSTSGPARVPTLRSPRRATPTAAGPPTRPTAAIADPPTLDAAAQPRGLAGLPWSQPPAGSEPGSRSSATLAHRSVAVTGPTNVARTTPPASATTTDGTAFDAVALVQRAGWP